MIPIYLPTIFRINRRATVTGNGEDGVVVVVVVVVEGMLSSGWNLISWHARTYIKTLLSAVE